MSALANAIGATIVLNTLAQSRLSFFRRQCKESTGMPKNIGWLGTGQHVSEIAYVCGFATTPGCKQQIGSRISESQIDFVSLFSDPLEVQPRDSGHYSSHKSLQSRSLIVDDLSAQLAPLDMYGLTNLASAAVDGLIALFCTSRKRPRALARARSTDM
jgi:hypothetical protein